MSTRSGSGRCRSPQPQWTTGPTTCPACRPSPCSSTAPPASGPSATERRRTCGWSPTSCGGSTGCRWRSSWPPGRLSTFSLDRPARPARPLAGPARRRTARRRRPAPDAARDGRVVLPAAVRGRSSGCSGTCRCSSTVSTSPRPSGSRRSSASDADPGAALARLVDASMIDASTSPGAPGTGCWRRCGRSGSTGWRRPASRRRRGGPGALGSRAGVAGSTRRWPPTASPRRTPRCAASCPTCARRGGWRETAGGSTTPSRWSIWLFDAIAYRDLVELRDWAEELAEDPSITAHPRAGGSSARPRRRRTTAGTCGGPARFAEPAWRWRPTRGTGGRA